MFEALSMLINGPGRSREPSGPFLCAMEPGHDRLQHYFQWEVRSWSRAWPVWQRRLLPEKGGGQALALGERDGGLSLMLADQGLRTVCSDLRGPTERAHELHRACGRQALITYEKIDALSIPKPDASYDVVVFKSMIGALGTKGNQAAALREMHRVLKPGGVLLFAENLRGTRVHGWLRRRFVSWDHYWRYLDATDDKDLFAPFAQVELHATGLLANLGRSEAQRDLLARVDRLLMPLVPVRWRTILYGAAVK